MTLSPEQFEEVAERALDLMPSLFAELMDNLVIQIEDGPDEAILREMDLDPEHDTLYGLYTGVPLDDRGGWYGGVLPDVIVLYRRPLVQAFPNQDRLVREIQLTLLHEIGHHLGFDEEAMEVWEDEFEALNPASARP